MKKILLSLFIIFSFIFCLNAVKADGISISASSSAYTNEAFTVSYNYNGTTMGSFVFNYSYTGASCSIASVAGTVNGNKISGSNASGFGSGTIILKLNCSSSSAGTASFQGSFTEAFDLEGINELYPSGGSKSVSISVRPTEAPVVTQPITTGAPATQATTKRTTTKKAENNNTPVTEATTAGTTITTTEAVPDTNANKVDDRIELKSLKVVGYDLDFDPTQSTFNIDIYKGVKELYITAETLDVNSIVAGTGIVDIQDKTSIELIVTQGENNQTYVINLNYKESTDVVYTGDSLDDVITISKTKAIILVVFTLLIIVILIIAFIFHDGIIKMLRKIKLKR